MQTRLAVFDLPADASTILETAASAMQQPAVGGSWFSFHFVEARGTLELITLHSSDYRGCSSAMKPRG
jgi:hypothetical protein